MEQRRLFDVLRRPKQIRSSIFVPNFDQEKRRDFVRLQKSSDSDQRNVTPLSVGDQSRNF